MIRTCGQSDLDCIAEIGNKAWQPIYNSTCEILGQELFSLLVEDRTKAKGEQIVQHWREHPDQILVCEEEGKIIGFVTWTIMQSTKTGEIGNNAVDPECGKKGIGQQLYNAVFEKLRAAGMRYVKVTTGLDEAHAPARRAYERAGFSMRRENVTYYRRLSDDKTDAKYSHHSH